MRAPSSLIFAMIMAFTISPRLASIYLIAVIILGFFLGLIIKFATKYFNQVFKKYDNLNASVQENVSAIRVVKSFVREDNERQKFGNANSNIYKLFLMLYQMEKSTFVSMFGDPTDTGNSNFSKRYFISSFGFE